jgi:hypothetical protein
MNKLDIEKFGDDTRAELLKMKDKLQTIQRNMKILSSQYRIDPNYIMEELEKVIQSLNQLDQDINLTTREKISGDWGSKD